MRNFGFWILDFGFRRTNDEAASHGVYPRGLGAARRAPPPGQARRLACGFARRGITLLEVLIAIFVLAIGLLSVAALLPVAAFQAQRATINTRAADLGRQIARDFKSHGFNRPDYWFYSNGPLATFIDPLQPPNLPFADSTATKNGTRNLQPVALDPIICWSLVPPRGSYPIGSVPPFAAAPSGQAGLTMPRLFMFPESALTTLSGVWDPVAQTAAAEVEDYASFDDTIFNIPANDSSAPPTGLFGKDPSTGMYMKRSYAQQYSWMATMVPTWFSPAVATPVSGYNDPNYAFNRNLMQLSVVVFNQRNLVFPPAGTVQPAGQPPIWPERSAQVQFTGGGYGSGDVVISSTSDAAGQANVTLKPGEWLMLGWMVSYSYPPGSSAATTYQSPYFRWCRIVSAGTPYQVNGNGNWTRNVTLAGIDINVNGPQSNPPGTMVANSAYAFIYDGAVAVYEKTIRLDDYIDND